MKVAISIDRKFVSAHFGRCPEYLIAEIKDSKIIKSESFPNPGHAPGFIPEFLHSKGVNAIICGGIGTRATDIFNSYGIKVIAGVTGDANETLDSFMKKTLKANEESLCAPGAGRGYGLDKTVCDHPHEE